MAIVKIKALKIRQNGTENVPWFGKEVSIDSRQITSVTGEGLTMTEITMANGNSYVVGGRASQFERLMRM